MIDNIRDFRIRDLRLTMLKSLKAQQTHTANEKILQMEAGVFGLAYTREEIRNELRFLERAQAVKITEPGSVMVATLRQRGEDHLNRLIELEGVDAPSLEG